MDWTKLADDETVDRTKKALIGRGFETIVVDTGEEAKNKLLELLPDGAQVMEGSSTTLDQIGVTSEIEDSGKYNSMRKQLYAITDSAKRNEARKGLIGSDYGIGSMQAITEKGELVSVSATGSQLASYVYGASKLILVVSTMKIVKSLDEAFMRSREHTLKLETERMKKAYGIGSSLNKILIIEKERPGRITVILVKERLGF